MISKLSDLSKNILKNDYNEFVVDFCVVLCYYLEKGGAFVDIITTFSTNLKNILEEKNMKQNKLAEKTGIKPQTISRYIKGDCLPDLDNVIKISQELHVSIDDILGNEQKDLTEIKKYSKKGYILDLVNIIDTFDFEIKKNDNYEYVMTFSMFENAKQIEDESEDIDIEDFLDAWVGYRDLFQKGHITVDDYMALITSKAERKFGKEVINKKRFFERRKYK